MQAARAHGERSRECLLSPRPLSPGMQKGHWLLTKKTRPGLGSQPGVAQQSKAGPRGLPVLPVPGCPGLLVSIPMTGSGGDSGLARGAAHDLRSPLSFPGDRKLPLQPSEGRGEWLQYCCPLLAPQGSAGPAQEASDTGQCVLVGFGKHKHPDPSPGSLERGPA